MKLTVAIGCACWISVASAILYPVHPVANSVFSGGSQNTISWIDEGSKPSLADMGLVSMDLYVDKTTTAKYLMNLAQDVDARKLSEKVFLPPSIWSNSSTFYILFTSTRTKPPTTVYTSDFTIVGLTGTGDINHGNSSSPSPSSATAPSTKINNGKSGPSTSTLGLSFAVTGSSSTSQSQPSNSESSASLPSIAPKSNAAATSRRRQVSNNSRYNPVFVMWPALFGLAMAL